MRHRHSWILDYFTLWAKLILHVLHVVLPPSEPLLWKSLQRVTCVLWMWWHFTFEWLNVTFQIRGGAASQGSEERPCCCEARVPLIPCNETNTRRSGHRAPLESQKLCCLTQEAAICVHVHLLRYPRPVDTYSISTQMALLCCSMEVTHDVLAITNFWGSKFGSTATFKSEFLRKCSARLSWR